VTHNRAVNASLAPTVPRGVDVGAGRVTAAALLALGALALLTGTLVMTIADGESMWWFAAVGTIAVPAVAGLLVALYRPTNLIGWLLLGDALAAGLAGFVHPYAHYGLVVDPGALPGARWALLWDNACWPTLFAALVALVLVFPDGRLPGGRLRSVAIATAACWIVVQLATLLEPQNYGPPYAGVSNPLPELPGAARTALSPFWIAAFASLFGAAWAIRVRFRRAEGPERLQLLWLTYGALLIPLVVIVCLAESAVGGGAGFATDVVFAFVLTVVPGSIGVAIFRYGLFDIELVLSRTLLYGTLTGCVVAGYLGLFVGLDRVLHVRGVAGVAAAGLVALGFQPLRVLVQRRVERLVYGDRADPYGALARLGQRLQSAPDPDEVLTTIVEGVTTTLRLGYCGIILSDRVVAERGSAGREPQTTVPLEYQGEVLGALVAEPPPRSALGRDARRLLHDLAAQAGVAVHGVRLMADLQQSRERLVTAREEERLRLRRDLHDGLGPTLAALVLKIDLIRQGARGDPDGTAERLRELGGATQSAIGDIRRLVYELRPPALDELGLVDALREQAAALSDGSGVVIEVRSAVLPQLPAAVEVAAYRIVTEAMTNVVRHAAATSCTVTLTLTLARGLEIAIEDDGVGFDTGARLGIGVNSMRERATELGGTLEIDAGRGTRISAHLPVAG
jgi:signal transduction histidine kinase